MNSPPIAPLTAGTSTRPYLIRALHDWCTDNGFTPYLAVLVDAQVHVPIEYVKNNEIVLNVGFEATTALKLGNEAIEFKARFGGVSREIVVPVEPNFMWTGLVTVAPFFGFSNVVKLSVASRLEFIVAEEPVAHSNAENGTSTDFGGSSQGPPRQVCVISQDRGRRCMSWTAWTALLKL